MRGRTSDSLCFRHSGKDSLRLSLQPECVPAFFKGVNFRAVLKARGGCALVYCFQVVFNFSGVIRSRGAHLAQPELATRLLASATVANDSLWTSEPGARPLIAAWQRRTLQSGEGKHWKTLCAFGRTSSASRSVSESWARSVIPTQDDSKASGQMRCFQHRLPSSHRKMWMKSRSTLRHRPRIFLRSAHGKTVSTTSPPLLVPPGASRRQTPERGRQNERSCRALGSPVLRRIGRALHA